MARTSFLIKGHPMASVLYIVESVSRFPKAKHQNMASIKLPDSFPSPTQDSERLSKALQGLSSFLFFSVFFYLFSAFSLLFDQYNEVQILLFGFLFFVLVYLVRERSRWKCDSMDIGAQECIPKEKYQRNLSTAL